MGFLGFLAFVGVISYLSFRSNFFGMKIMAGMAWIGFVIYVITYPPFSLVAGEPAHIFLILVSIGIGVMIVLAGLGRGIKRTEDSSGNFSASSEGFQLKMPDWMKNQFGGGETPEQRKRRMDTGLEEYRRSMHRALHPNENERRRR